MYADIKQTIIVHKTTIISEHLALLKKSSFPLTLKKEPVAKYLCIIIFGDILTI
jgi:hypothetical protein